MSWLSITTGLVLVAAGLAALVFYKRKQARAEPVSAVDPDGLLDTNLTLKHDLPYGTGRIYVDGKLWKVRSDGRLEAGQSVRITDLDGDTLIIQPNKFTQAALKQAS